jgi:hypothetical protein
VAPTFARDGRTGIVSSPVAPRDGPPRGSHYDCQITINI